MNRSTVLKYSLALVFAASLLIVSTQLRKAQSPSVDVNGSADLVATITKLRDQEGGETERNLTPEISPHFPPGESQPDATSRLAAAGFRLDEQPNGSVIATLKFNVNFLSHEEYRIILYFKEESVSKVSAYYFFQSL